MELAKIIEQLTPANRQLAEQLVSQLAARDGIEVQETAMPGLSTCIELWVVWMKTEGFSPRTLDMYEKDLRRYLTKDPTPTAISIQTYIARRLQAVTACRVNGEMKSIKSFFKYCKEYGLMSNNPVDRLRKVKEHKKEVVCPDNDDIMALLNHKLMRAKDERKFKIMLMLLLNTGLRMEEACCIIRDNINFTHCEIKVLGKGGKERIVPISPLIVQLLRDYLAASPNKAKYLFPGNTPNGHWGHCGFEGAVRLACKKLGIAAIHPHQFRHFFATRTLEHGAKLEVISKILGHSSVAITADIYRHILVKELHGEHAEHDPLKQLPIHRLLTEGREDVPMEQDEEVVEGEAIEIK